jgi:pyridoxamine 5'-phosphate oxidase
MVIRILSPLRPFGLLIGMTTAPLNEPFERFHDIFLRAQQLPKDCFPEPNAMALATVSPDGQPSNRIVLLKGYDERGFVFYTNYDGRKGQELLKTPKAALCFHWAPLEMQIRIEGTVESVSAEEADAYFASRARASQIGAWASLQSRPMAAPDDLQRRVAEFEAQFAGGAVPRPPHWSGFRVVPGRIEFWHSQPSRLHDRQLYVRVQDGWAIETLYP